MCIRDDRRFLRMTVITVMLAAVAVRGQPAPQQEEKATVFRTDTRLGRSACNRG